MILEVLVKHDLLVHYPRGTKGKPQGLQYLKQVKNRLPPPLRRLQALPGLSETLTTASLTLPGFGFGIFFASIPHPSWL